MAYEEDEVKTKEDKKQKKIKLSQEDEKRILKCISDDFDSAQKYQDYIFDRFVSYYEYYRGVQSIKDQGTWRAKIRVPYIKQVIDTILPRMVSNKPTINVLPREFSDIQGAQMYEKFVLYQWDKLKMNEKVKMWEKMALIYGTGLVKIGWAYDEDEDDNGLWIEVISPYDFFIDPNAHTIDSSWVIYKQERTLDYIKENDLYDVPDDIDALISADNDKNKNAQNNSLGRSTPTPTDSKKVLVYEYYGQVEVEEGKYEQCLVVTANNVAVLRIERLEDIYPCGNPFVALYDDKMPLEFWGIGEVEPLIALQDELDTLRNQRLDNRNLIINHMWLVNKNGGINWDDFVSRPGGVIECDDINAVKPLPINDTTGSSVQEEAIVKQDMDRTSGVFAGMTGQLQNPISGGTNITTTARGFLASIEQAGTKMQYKLDNLDDALRTLGQKILKMNQKYITKDQIIRVIGKAGVDFETIPLEAIKADYDLKIEGGSTQPQNKEARRQANLNLLSFIAPFLQAPLYEYEPGRPPIQTQLNMKYFIDNILNNEDLPNREEAYISSQDMGNPSVPGLGQEFLSEPPAQQPVSEQPPQGILSQLINNPNAQPR